MFAPARQLGLLMPYHATGLLNIRKPYLNNKIFSLLLLRRRG